MAKFKKYHSKGGCNKRKRCAHSAKCKNKGLHMHGGAWYDGFVKIGNAIKSGVTKAYDFGKKVYDTGSKVVDVAKQIAEPIGKVVQVARTVTGNGRRRRSKSRGRGGGAKGMNVGHTPMIISTSHGPAIVAAPSDLTGNGRRRRRSQSRGRGGGAKRMAWIPPPPPNHPPPAMPVNVGEANDHMMIASGGVMRGGGTLVVG